MDVKLTAKQQVVYDFIRKEIKRNGYAPSVREICDGVGLSSTSTVHTHLETLRNKGYIKRFPSKNRTIEILEDGFYTALRDHLPVPIVSKLIKNEPVLQKEHITGYHLVLTSSVGDGDCFMYSIGLDDDDEKIKTGDLVLVKLQSKVKIGELALAYGSDEAVIKRVQQKKDAGKEIIGKVLELFRRY